MSINNESSENVIISGYKICFMVGGDLVHVLNMQNKFELKGNGITVSTMELDGMDLTNSTSIYFELI